MNITPGKIFRQQNPYENIIQEMLRADGQRKRELQSQEKTLQAQKSAISDIGSKLTAFNSLLSTFTDPFSHTLRPLSGQSSNSEAVAVLSTAGMESTGNYNISVSQLAKNDVMLSDSMSGAGSTLSTSGSASFTIDVNGKSANIAVNTSNLTSREVMDAIAKQVNDQLGDELQASVFNLGNGDDQLSFKSTQSGEQSYISVSNVQGDAAALNLNNIFSKSSLNAKFTIDHVTFERSSNRVDDAVEGLTLQLKQITNQTEQISITNDTDSARENVQKFIDKFNSVNSIIRQETFLNGDTGSHGPLRDKRMVRNISYQLRNDAALPVQSMSGQNIQSLADIGIALKRDGSMYVEDSDKLDKALQNSPDSVKQLFTADDGLAGRLQTTIDAVIKGESNMVDTLKNSIDSKIDRLDDRIADQNDYLDREEQRLRSKFSQLQQLKRKSQLQLRRLSIYRQAIN